MCGIPPFFSTSSAIVRSQEETFGPVVGIMAVSSDDEAIKLMNDSPYGLTASVWTDAASNPDSEAAFLRFVEELDTGTVFLNRCVSSTFSFLSFPFLSPLLYSLLFPFLYPFSFLQNSNLFISEHTHTHTHAHE